MAKIDTTPSSPVLIRAYKKEAELEIWKMKSDGRYALLKTYPICRWSGQLGPKKTEGDMQVPEGFYTIAPGQMNPNSHYYLAFNVGYPNAYDRAYGRTGGSVMVHGVCSSAGCFSMTDEQVADIYAIARDAFRGGQREIQLQSYPFRMTAENHGEIPARSQHRLLERAEERLRPFRGRQDRARARSSAASITCLARPRAARSTRARPVRRSNATRRPRRWSPRRRPTTTPRSPNSQPPASKPIRTIYADGGQNPVFAGYKDTSDPDALAGGPEEIVLNDAAKPAVVKVAAADAARKRAAEPIAQRPAPALVQTAAAPAPAAPPQTVALASTAAGGVAGVWGASTQNVKKWLNFGGQDQPAQPEVTAFVPEQPIPTDVPLPPRRDASLGQSEKPLHFALKTPTPPASSAAAEAAPSRPDETAAPAAGPAAAPSVTAPAAAQ